MYAPCVSYPLARIKAQEGMRAYLESNNYECLEQVLFRVTSSTRQ